MPHAWIARPVRLDEAHQPAAFLREGDFQTATRAIVEEAVEGIASADVPSPTDAARVETSGASEISEQVTCARACFVVDRDAFDSDWRADVDGIGVRTYAADADLRGVVVPAGTHRLRFRFFPTSLAAGAVLTLLAAITLVIRWRALRV